MNNKLHKVIVKAHSLEQGKDLALAEEFIALDEKIDTKIDEIKQSVDTISEELKKKLEEELVYEVDEQKIVESVLSKVEIPEPIKGDKGDDGKDGQNYNLTEQDKKEIAGTIEVPIVEKIVVEQPIYNTTEIIKEIALADTGEVIVNKINELPLEDEYRIDASHIKNLPKAKNDTVGARLLSALGDVNTAGVTNGQTLIYNSSLGRWEVGTSSGGSPSGPQYAVQVNNGAGGFYGDIGFTYDGSILLATAANGVTFTDGGSSTLFLGFGQVNFGDVGGAGNSTQFYLDDSVMNIIFAYLGVNTTVFSPGLLDTSTDIRAYHYTGKTGTPTFALLGGAGAGATGSIVGNDLHCELRITCGAVPTAGAVVATITWDKPFNTTRTPVISPMNERSAASGIYVIGTGVSTFDIVAPTVALQGLRDYQWSITMTE